jgi:serine/threonine protein kinase
LVPVQTLGDWPNDDRLGKVVAQKYAIYDVLGRGGFGAVYAGWQDPPGRAVAIKLLRRDVAHRPGVLDRFYREAQVVARVNHPGAVSLFDYGADADGALYMAFELVDGVTLDIFLAREGGRLSVGRAARIVRGILEPLAEAHAEGAVHRDLKPTNIMVHTDLDGVDHVKVLDFGIAKVVGPDAGKAITLAGHAGIIGTPRYMAPEQAQGLDVDGRADLYSVGVIFFELLTGHAPFDARSPFATLLAHQESPIPELPPELEVPLAVSGIIRTALAKVPLHRYADAGSMRRALDAAFGERSRPPLDAAPPSGEIVEIGPVTEEEAVVSPWARYGLRSWLALVGLLTVVAAIAAVLVLDGPSGSGRRGTALPPDGPASDAGATAGSAPGTESGAAVAGELAAPVENSNGNAVVRMVTRPSNPAPRDPLSVVRQQVRRGDVTTAAAVLEAALLASPEPQSLWAAASADAELDAVRFEPALAGWRRTGGRGEQAPAQVAPSAAESAVDGAPALAPPGPEAGR